MTEAEVRAAGGVLLRRIDGGGDGEVLLVHRPRYDDWTFPKGKLEPGEEESTAALREVLEETGYRGRILGEVGRVRYVDRRGRDKEVVYFQMDPGPRDDFRPNAEIDVVRWTSLGRAPRVLSYPHDAEVLAAALRRG